jgi:hypothetical protein
MPLELLIGAAVGAGLVSDKVRKKLRKGVVYGLAGALMAYDRVSEMATNIRNSSKEKACADAAAPAQASSECKTPGGPTPGATS